MQEVVNVIDLVLAVILLASCLKLIVPIRGSRERPLLEGILGTAVFILYVCLIRVFSLQSLTRPSFGFVITAVLLFKLRSVWAASTGQRFPAVAFLIRQTRRAGRMES